MADGFVNFADPRFLNLSPVYLPEPVDSKERNTLNAIIIVSVVGTALFALWILVNWYLRRKQSVTQQLEYEISTTDQMERLVRNYHLQIILLFKLWGHIKNIWPAWLLLCLWISGVIVIAEALKKPLDYTDSTRERQKMFLIGFCLFFVGCIGFYVNRVYEYYKVKLHRRKRALALRKARQSAQPPQKVEIDPPVSDSGRSNLTDTTDSNIRSIASDSEGRTPSETLTEAEDVQPRPPVTAVTVKRGPSARLIRSVSAAAKQVVPTNIKPRLKHLSPQYTWFNTSFHSLMQIFILVVEFLQLCSFPIRELLNNYYFVLSLERTGDQEAVARVENFFKVIVSGFPTLDNLFLSAIEFSFAWWLTITGILFGLLCFEIQRLARFQILHDKLPDRVMAFLKFLARPTFLIHVLPLVNLFYLPVMQAFLSKLSCFIDNVSNSTFDNSRLYRCYRVVVFQPQAYVAFALVGYILAYFSMTIFRTSNEPKPRPGVISFTSRSEVFNKNGALLMLIVYYLFIIKDSQNDTLAVLRGVLASIISLVMVVYNVKVGSSYVRSINYWRPLGYCCVFYLNLVVTYYIDPKHQEVVVKAGTKVFIVIFGGWVVVCLLFSSFWWWYRSRLGADVQIIGKNDVPKNDSAKDNFSSRIRDSLNSINILNARSANSASAPGVDANNATPTIEIVSSRPSPRSPNGASELRQRSPQKTSNLPSLLVPDKSGLPPVPMPEENTSTKEVVTSDSHTMNASDTDNETDLESQVSLNELDIAYEGSEGWESGSALEQDEMTRSQIRGYLFKDF